MQFEDFSIPDDDNMSVADSLFVMPTSMLNTTTKPLKWTSIVSIPYKGETRMKKVKTRVYETSTLPLMNIRRAITGTLTPYKVGTREEDYFFIVNLATAPQGRKTPARLFFDSPCDFENHCMVQVNPEIKTKWQHKQYEIERRMREEKNRE